MANSRSSGSSGQSLLKSWNGNKLQKCPELSPAFYTSQTVQLEKLSKEGNAVAQKYAEACKALSSLLNTLRTEAVETDPSVQSRVFLHLATILKTDVEFFPSHPVLLITLTKLSDLGFKKQNSQTSFVSSELDKAIRICHVYFTGIKSPLEALNLAINSQEKYPSEPFFYLIQCHMLEGLERLDEGFQVVTSALKKFPTHLGLLYIKASLVKRDLITSFETQLEAWRTFLHHSSKSDRHVPEFHYKFGCLPAHEYLPRVKTCREFTRGLHSMKNALKCGEDAEKCILPCNLKDLEYCLALKSQLKENILQAELFLPELDSECEVTQQKIKYHRSLLYTSEFSTYQKIQEHISKSLIAGIATTTIMSPSSQWIKYSSIEPALVTDTNSSGKPTLTLLLQQDFFGPVFECHVFNFDISKFYQVGRDIQELFGIGCKFSFAQSIQKVHIRIDNPYPDSLLFHTEERLNLPCSYCGVENAPNRCGPCKVAMYCDKYCQIRDWKHFGHKKFCRKMVC